MYDFIFFTIVNNTMKGTKNINFDIFEAVIPQTNFAESFLKHMMAFNATCDSTGRPSSFSLSLWPISMCTLPLESPLFNPLV